MSQHSAGKADVYPPIPPTPKAYWEDSDWADENFSKLAEDYPNLWVAVVDKKVVAAGNVISEVEKIAEEKTGRKSFPTVFAERGIHVY